MVEDKKVSMNIDDGEPFFSHETSINFSPTQFVLDFKNVTPRIDPRIQHSPIVCLKHNVILLDPYHAKKLSELLATIIKKYEAEFGKIDKPEALKKYERKAKKVKKIGTSAPTYFG